MLGLPSLAAAVLPPPSPPPPPPRLSTDWWAALKRPRGEVHDYATALRLSLYFYRTQRSGDLSGDPLTPPWRAAPSFATDGADVGVDLSRGCALLRLEPRHGTALVTAPAAAQ